jgi:hypothetical protein
VQLVLPAAWAELVQLHAARVISLVLARAVRAFLADGARQCDHGSILGLCHVVLVSSSSTPGPCPSARRPRQTRGGSPGESLRILLRPRSRRQRAAARRGRHRFALRAATAASDTRAMPIREPISQLQALGPFPSEEEATVEEVTLARTSDDTPRQCRPDTA